MSYNGLNTIKMWDEKQERYVNTKTFVLRDGSHAIVHIPVHKLAPVDRRRMLEIEKEGGEMLTQMRDKALDNGMNALILYDNLIEVYHKPQEKKEVENTAETTTQTESAQTQETTTEQAPPKKKRGRPPKNQTSG